MNQNKGKSFLVNKLVKSQEETITDDVGKNEELPKSPKRDDIKPKPQQKDELRAERRNKNRRAADSIAKSSQKNVDKKNIKGSYLKEDYSDGESFIRSSLEYKKYLFTILQAFKKKRGSTIKFFINDAIEEKLKREYPETLEESKKLYNIK